MHIYTLQEIEFCPFFVKDVEACNPVLSHHILWISKMDNKRGNTVGRQWKDMLEFDTSFGQLEVCNSNSGQGHAD